MAYWLMKSEPETFSIDALARQPQQTTHWDGVRNYQARNFIREMKPKDQVFFYHSNCQPPGIVGIAEVSKAAYPDFTAFHPESPYYDPKSTPDKPRWFMPDIRFKQKFDRMITLTELKMIPSLAHLALLKKGNRLSVMPIDGAAWIQIIHLLTPHEGVRDRFHVHDK